MYDEQVPEKAQKKDDPKVTHDQHAPKAEQQAGQGHLGPTPQANGDKASAVMTHWADEGKKKQGDGGTHADAKKPADAAPGPKMVHDERYSEDSDVIANGAARIIGVQIAEGRTRITIGLGHHHGVRMGMGGYVKKSGGMLADFQIERVEEKVAYASVDVTPDMLKEHSDVVVNPSQMPKSSEVHSDMKARVLAVSIVDGKTRISIGLGTSHGARAGMSGALVNSSGKPVEKFTVDEAHSTFCTAFVERTIDAVREHTDVILNAKGG